MKKPSKERILSAIRSHRPSKEAMGVCEDLLSVYDPMDVSYDAIDGACCDAFPYAGKYETRYIANEVTRILDASIREAC